MPSRAGQTKASGTGKVEIVRAKSLSVGYAGPDSAVCPPINVTVAAGESLAIIGANGTGKTTVLRALVGLLPPLSGEVFTFGRPIDERAAWFRAYTAILLDEDSYLPALTVREHLLLTARGHGMSGVSSLVSEMVQEFGLDARQDALPSALSSGQRRRLLLAAAFVRPRRLLVLDEPEQRLDAGMRDRLATRLINERRAGTTIVMASHDPLLVGKAATSALVLREDSVRRTSTDEAVRAIESL